MKTLFVNGYLCDHNSMYKADMLIEGETIVKIGKDLARELDEAQDKNQAVDPLKPQDGAYEIIDLNEKVILPSFVDLHVHFRDPGFTYKEDLETGARAALKGGFTIVNAMANTKPICDNPEIYHDIIKRAQALDLVDMFQVSALTKNLDGKELVDLSKFPQSLKFVSDDGKDLLTNHMMYEAMKNIAKTDIGIMIHAEESEISPYDYRAAEDLITIRDLYLSKRTGAKIHFCHVSTEDSIDAIRYAKSKHVNVTCEITPHHIFFSDFDYRVNPPIREKSDIHALIDAIKDGTVDAIATDHAPHSYEDKCKGSPGMIGLETAFAVCYTQLVKAGHIDLPKLSDIMSYRPAHILGLEHGELKEGKRADLTIVDINAVQVVSEEMFCSKSKNSPFVGMELTSKVVATIRKGNFQFREL